MARQEMLMARCDRKGCNTVIEIDRSTVAPEGWLQIAVEISGVWDTKSRLEFCSEKCVSLWARDRNKVIAHNGNGSAKNFRDEVVEAINILIADGTAKFSSTDVTNVAELNSGTVKGHMDKLSEEGYLRVIGGVGKKGNPLIYERTS